MAENASFRFPAATGMPLHALSPERVNKQSSKVIMMQSPTTVSELGRSNFLANSQFSKQNEQSTLSSNPGSPNRQENCSPMAHIDVSGFSPPKHWRTNSDVQNIVARFNSLDIRDASEERRKRDAAALKRAQMGREEAEAEVKKLKEDQRTAKSELEESKDRERRVMKRLDVVMEDLHRSKETQAHAQSLYEKEIRRARKEAFKASSTMVKLQEELKSARNSLKVLHSDFDLEKMKGAKREQEAFEAQYQLVGVQEELAKASARTKVVEEERDALKTSLREEEVARIAAEGMIALPRSRDGEDEFASPRKQKPVLRSQSPEKEAHRARGDVDHLRAEIEQHKRQRQLAEERVEYLQMECQFGCCSCRVAERRGLSFIHDGTFESEVLRFKQAPGGVPTPPESMAMDESAVDTVVPLDTVPTEVLLPATPSLSSQEILQPNEDIEVSESSRAAQRMPQSQKREQPSVQRQDEDSVMTDSREDQMHHMETTTTSGSRTSPTLLALDSYPPHNDLYPKHTLAQTQQPQPSSDSPPSPSYAESQVALPKTDPPLEIIESAEQDLAYAREEAPVDDEQPQKEQRDDLMTPLTTFRTVTTTTKVPLVDDSTPDYSAFCTPTTMTREEAIEQLRQRRGRARSIAGTPKKPGAQGFTPRRDISAPEVRPKATPRSVSKGRLAAR